MRSPTCIRLLVLALLALPLAAPVQVGRAAAPTWTQFGGPADDGAGGVAVDAAGNTYVVGAVGLALPGKAALGGADAFVRKYDRFGYRVWTDQFGSAAADGAGGVAVDGAGNVYVAGTVGGGLPGQASPGGALPGQVARGGTDAFVRKYAQGAGGAYWRVWTRQFGTPQDDSAIDVAVDRDGNVYVVGHVRGALPGQVAEPCPYFSAPPCLSSYLRTYDRDGNERWMRQFGASLFDLAGDVAVDGAGNAYLAGTSTGGEPPMQFFSGYSAFVRKYDRQGGLTWTERFGAGQYVQAGGLAVDAAGNVVVAGLQNGPLTHPYGFGTGEAFLRRYSQRDGGIVLAWNIGFGASSSGADVAIDEAGDLYLAGVINLADTTPTPWPGPGYPFDGFVRKYRQAAAGPQVVWTKQVGGPAQDGIGAVAAAGGGRVAAVGSTAGALPGQTALGGSDAFAARLGPD